MTPPEPAVPPAEPPAPVPPVPPVPAVRPAPVPYPDDVSVPAVDPAPASPRRWPRTALRWAAAVAVFGVVGGGVAYGVTRPERTRIPGLHTPDDGRWTYPPIALPKLPAGRPRPLSDANPGGRHYVDVRSLLLPAPLTATPDRAVPGSTGWLPVTTFLAVYDGMTAYRTDSEQSTLREDGLRHIAARAWTMPDGTRTDVFLLQFTSSAYAALYRSNVEVHALDGATDTVKDGTVASRSAVPPAVEVVAAGEKAPYGPTAARYAWLYAGDTIALVRQTRKGSVAEVPFRQTVRLQAQLLG